MTWRRFSSSTVLTFCTAAGGSLFASLASTDCLDDDISALGSSVHAHSYSDGHKCLATRMIIGDPDAFAYKIKKFTKDGPDHLLVITDFDRTLTPYYKHRNDLRTPLEQENSSHGLLMTSSVLQPQVRVGEQELFAKFYSIEMSPLLSNKEKLPFMEQWWNSAHALLVKYKLTREQVNKTVALESLSFRQGFHSLVKLLHDEHVPILIFSAGLYDVIHAVLEQKFAAACKHNGRTEETASSANQAFTPSNVHVVANMMRFNADGVIEGFDGEVIHSLNKTARVLLDSPFWKDCQMEKRRNVLLIGDSRGDVRMAEGLNADEIIRVGFLNVHVDEASDEYLELYDVVFTHDASLVPVQMLIEQITRCQKG
ncbi:unnamed protein product [Peronospora destructor]|uniref:5'-nucleotidase n=1 Tax=Peronospora destructor TaxID=86335 RepID=A0AAV0T0R8_9STRA|nr:unnamed protein product [Peronospora destructor]